MLLLPDETKPPAVLMKLISQDNQYTAMSLKIRDDYVQNINVHKITNYHGMICNGMIWGQKNIRFFLFNCKSTGKKTPHEFCDPPFLLLFTLPHSAHSTPGRKFRELIGKW